MPQNRNRDEENSKRKQRIAKIKRGPGSFVYDGSLFETEWIPTIKLVGKHEPVLDEGGFPVVDGSGRQVFKRSGEPVKDENGKPVLGGTPKIKRTPLDTFTVRGTAFPKGEPVAVNAALAFKLRCMDGFDEVDGAVVGEGDGEASAEGGAKKKKRGRPKKNEGTETTGEGEASTI